MKDDSGVGCLLLILVIVVIILPFKLTKDFLEKRDLCYELIPFCESEKEKEEKIFAQYKETMRAKAEIIAQKTSPIKWHKVTEYKTKDGGYIYYLGTNSMNGIYLYWNGDIENFVLQTLDYQAQDKLRIKIYEGRDRIELMDEFLESEEAKPLVEKAKEFFN